MSTQTHITAQPFDQEKPLRGDGGPELVLPPAIAARMGGTSGDDARESFDAARVTGAYDAAISVDQIVPHPRNVRADVGDLEELVASIRVKGILQPLLVAPHPSREGDFVLLAGHRRLAAAKRAGLRTVPATIRRDLTDDAAQLEVMLSENLQRADLTVMEEAKAYQVLLEFPGYDVNRIAKKTGRSASTVRRRLELTHTPETVQDQIVSGDVPLERALVIAQVEDDPEAVEKLAAVAAAPEWSWTTTSQHVLERHRWTKAIPVLKEWLVGLGDGAVEIGEDLRSVLAALDAEDEEITWRWVDGLDAPTVGEDGVVDSHSVEARATAEKSASGDLTPALLTTRPWYIVWLSPETTGDDEGDDDRPSRPRESAEQVAQQEERRRLETALRIDRAQAAEALKYKLAHPGTIKGTARAGMVHLIMGQSAYQMQTYADLLDVDVDIPGYGTVPEEDRAQVRQALEKLTVDQLVLLEAMVRTGVTGGEYCQTYDLTARSPHNASNRGREYRQMLAEVWGLTETETDRAVAAFWEPHLEGTDTEAGA